MQPVTSIQRTLLMKDLDARVCKGLRGMHAACRHSAGNGISCRGVGR